MIINFLLQLVFVFLNGLFLVINIPRWGVEISAAFNFVTTMIVQGTAFLCYLLTPPIFAFGVLCLFATLNFSWLYGIARWLVEKIPSLNIRF